MKWQWVTVLSDKALIINAQLSYAGRVKTKIIIITF